jgi:hypothetical protein
MATTTTSSTPTSTWVVVADGADRCAIQRHLLGSVRVHVGQSAPDADSGDYILLAGQDRWLSLSDLAAGDKVYTRAHGDYPARITVLTGA